MKKDITSEIWGPHLWIYLHTLSYSYPEEPSSKERDEYNFFLESLKEVLPCEKCRIHYKEYLKKNEPKLGSRKELSEWMIDLHNNVNKMNKKREYTYEEVNEIYKKMYEKKSTIHPLKDSKLKDSKLKYILIIVIIIIIITWNKLRYRIPI